MLLIDKVSVHRGKQLLKYDFSLAEGLIMTVQGRSGAGKSTLLDLIAGFLQPESGDILWNGQSLLPLSVELRPVSMLFQANNLFEHISVLKNLQLGLNIDPVQAGLTAGQIQFAADALEVGALLQRKPAELSGGQRQRIALLRTLLRPEPLVLLDEPFTGLDDETRELAAEWTLHTARKERKTVLLITHQDDDVTRLADVNLRL
ncbi:MAG: ATP-binding cassette domain-containing protein [Thiolinea sp.]